MIIYLLISFLFLLVVSAIIFFILKILLPSLKEEKVNESDLLFAEEEVNYYTGEPEFRNNETGLKAVVLCSPERSFNAKRIDYRGKKDCSLFKSIYSTEYDCSWSCSGFGNCISACPRQAISIKNNTAVIDHTVCNGCGLCIESCPKHIIELIPEDQNVCEHCKASEEEKNSCSMYGKTLKIDYSNKKRFKFWEKCYKILYRK